MFGLATKSRFAPVNSFRSPDVSIVIRTRPNNNNNNNNNKIFYLKVLDLLAQVCELRKESFLLWGELNLESESELNLKSESELNLESESELNLKSESERRKGGLWTTRWDLNSYKTATKNQAPSWLSKYLSVPSKWLTPLQSLFCV